MHLTVVTGLIMIKFAILLEFTVGQDWSNWGQWGSCDVTCGRGGQTRTRQCVGSGTCEGDSSEIKTCLHATVCPCVCSGPSCVDDYPTYCPTQQSHLCGNDWFDPYCKKTCNACSCHCGTWSDWSAWGKCPATCGDVHARTRTCPTGFTCNGGTTQTQRCSHPNGCVATWSSWSTWGSCTGPCGSGSQSRSRTCVGGSSCPGSATETQSCVVTCRGVGYWGPCSRTCGQGTKRKQNVNGSVEYDDCHDRQCPQKRCFYMRRRYSVNQHSCCDNRKTSSCGISGQKGRIINGTQSEAHRWPWMVQLTYLYDDLKKIEVLLCGGILISDTWILTAAHCVDGIRENLVSLKLAATLKEDRVHRQTRSIRRIQIHPRYNRLSLRNDIALIQFDSPVFMGLYVRPICLPQGEEALADNMCVAAGWGTKSYGALQTSHTLMEVDLRILPVRYCNQAKMPPSNPFVEETNICAGAIRGGVDTCQGDSGGPLMCQRCSNCAWFVAGITSFGLNCGQPNQPGVYTKISAYENWIRFVSGVGEAARKSACQQ